MRLRRQKPTRPPLVPYGSRFERVYPVIYGREWGEGAWTATDLVHGPGSAHLLMRNMSRLSLAGLWSRET